MKLQSITYHGIRGLAEGAIALDRCVITGPVGAGKSTLVDLVQIALTGSAPRGDLRTLAGPSGAGVTVTFSVGESTYRAVATARKSKSAQSVERLIGEDWQPVEGGIAAVLGADVEAIAAALFLRCKGADGHGTFGPAGPTGRRALLSTLDRELSPDLFGEWAAGEQLTDAVRDRVRAKVALPLRADLPVRATAAGREARAKLEAVAAGTARVDETQRRSAEDRATVDLPVILAPNLGRAESELDEARRTLAVARAEAERAQHATSTRTQAEARRIGAQARLEALGPDPVAEARAKLEALRAEYGTTKARGVSLLAEAAKLDAEANALEAESLATWRAYRDEEQCYNAAVSAVERAAAQVAQLEPALEGVVVPCRAADPYKGCKFLSGTVAARAALPAARERLAAARAALAELTEPAQPDTMARARRVDELRADAINLRTEEAHCRKRCQAIVTESAPLKALEANGDGERARLEAIISAPLPEAPAAPDVAPFVAEVERCAAVVTVLRAERDAATQRETLRRAAAERLAAADSRVATLLSAVASDRADAEVMGALERFYREVPRLAVNATLTAIEEGANAFLASAGFGRVVALSATDPDAKGIWKVIVTVGDDASMLGGVLRETLSEGQLLTVDLALSAGYRAAVGLDGWHVVDDGFGALGRDEADAVAAALGGGWVVTHSGAVEGALRTAGWSLVEVLPGEAGAEVKAS